LCPRHVPFTQYKRERPHYPNKRTGWLPADAPGLCHFRTFTADEVVRAKAYSATDPVPRVVPSLP
jgi:hypothetical protein